MWAFIVCSGLISSAVSYWLGSRAKEAYIRRTMTELVLSYGREADQAINQIQALWEEGKEGGKLREEFNRKILRSDTAIEIFRRVFNEQDDSPIR